MKQKIYFADVIRNESEQFIKILMKSKTNYVKVIRKETKQFLKTKRKIEIKLLMRFKIVV